MLQKDVIIGAQCSRVVKVKVKVKVEFSLCLTKHHTMKTYWGVEI
jgi:hypothetical protein